jgi:hypothetical protein
MFPLQRFNDSTNPWHAIASRLAVALREGWLATAARGESLIIRRRGFFGYKKR